MVPSFAGSPLPNHRPGEEARAASIVVSYFHPWTLRVFDATVHWPFAGNLRKSTDSWQEAMPSLLYGIIACEEARRYVGSFLSVHRMKPMDDDASGADNSDDILGDEDVRLSSDTLLDALRTRTGGAAHIEAATDDDNDELTANHAISSAAVRLSEEVWGEATAPNKSQASRSSTRLQL